jgi:hypothetical protein
VTKEKYLLVFVLVFRKFLFPPDPEEWETPRRYKSLPMTVLNQGIHGSGV